MKWKEWLENWSMTSLKINLNFLEMQWEPKDADKNAAWELYIEMLTRIATQYLVPDHGDDKTSLDSVHSLFNLTREIIKKYGRECIEFTKIAIVVLNQKIRPFTAKWHKESLAGAFKDENKCKIFRKELENLQKDLRNYTKMLGNMAGIEEDLTNLEME